MPIMNTADKNTKLKQNVSTATTLRTTINIKTNYFITCRPLLPLTMINKSYCSSRTAPQRFIKALLLMGHKRFPETPMTNTA